MFPGSPLVVVVRGESLGMRLPLGLVAQITVLIKGPFFLDKKLKDELKYSPPIKRHTNCSEEATVRVL